MYLSNDIFSNLIGPGAAPENLRSVVYYSTIFLEWNEVNSTFLSSTSKSYQVFFSTGTKTSESDLTSIGHKIMATDFEVSDLVPGTNYSFAVSVVSQNVSGPISKILHISTRPGISQSNIVIIFVFFTYLKIHTKGSLYVSILNQ